jgi:hypothetical protein
VRIRFTLDIKRANKFEGLEFIELESDTETADEPEVTDVKSKTKIGFRHTDDDATH